MGGQRDGIDDLGVPGATAEIPGNGGPDRFLIRGRASRQGREVGVTRDQHARCADPALRTARLQEGLLQSAQALAIGHSFDRSHARPFNLAQRHHAGVDDLAVEQHGAGSAFALAAPSLVPGETQVFTQNVEQPAHPGRFDLRFLAVYGEPIAHGFTVLMPGKGGGSMPASAARVRSGVAGKSSIQTPVAS